MINIERNADLVHMATYAPLFAHVEGWQWRPDAIWFDNLKSARTTAYHVQALYAQNKGTNVLPTTLSINGGKPSVNPVPSGEDGLFASAVLDKNTNEIIIKAVNTRESAQTANIYVKGVKKLAPKATVITLDLSDYDADNTPDDPERVKPVTTTMPVAADKVTSFEVTVPARSFCIYKIQRAE